MVNKIMAYKLLSLTIFISSLAFSNFTMADVVTFTLTGSGSGSMDGSSFGTSDFTITAIGDTANVEPVPGFPNSIRISPSSAQITIVGLGDFMFSSQVSFFRNSVLQQVGMALTDQDDLIFGPTDPSIQNWDMLSSIGPLSGSGELLNWNDLIVNTSGGRLIFDDVNPVNTTYSAVVAAVPEPGTCGVLWAGLAGLVMRRRR